MVFEFYTYSGFNVIVPVFQSIAILFNSSDYLKLFGIFTMSGIFLVSFFSSVKSLSGQSSSILNWVLPLLLSLAAFQAMVLPKATVAVHDPTQNQSQVVGDVPLIIALSAGMFNLIERSIVEVIESATGSVYGDDATGISFALIREASQRSLTASDSFLTKTIDEYIKKCGEIAINSQVGVSDALIKRGTDDLRTGLSGMAMPAWPTVVYNSSNKAGLVVNCKEAWDIHIAPNIDDTDFENLKAELCRAVGFDKNSSAQMTKCQSRMQESMRYFGVPQGTFNSAHFVRNFYLAQRFAMAVRDSPDMSTLALTNRNAVVQGVGMFTAAAEFMPQVKAIITGVSLSLIPLLALLFVTPLSGKAFMYVGGIFGWLTLWGTIDASMHNMSITAAEAYMENLDSLGFALDGIYRAGDSSSQALALFGKIRSFSIMLASALSMALFRFGSYSFSQMTEGLSQHIESLGSDAAMKTQTPEGVAQTMNQMTDAMSAMAIHSNHSPQAIAQNTFMSKNADIAKTQTQARLGAANGQNSADVSAMIGTVGGASSVGSMLANQALTKQQGGDPNKVDDLANTAQNVAASQTAMSNATAISQAQVHGGPQGKSPVHNKSGQEDSTLDQLQTMTESAMQTTTTEARGRKASSDVKSEMASFIHNDNGVSEQQAYKSVEQFNQNSAYANILATDGNANKHLSILANDASMDLAKKNALVEAGLDLGMSPEHMGDTLGKFGAAEISGKHDALHQLLPEEISSGFLANHLRHSESAAAMEQLAGDNSMTLRDFIYSKEGIEASRSMAQIMKTEMIAEQFGESNTDAILRQEGSQIMLTTSGDDTRALAEKLYENKSINEDQYDYMLAKAESGEVVHTSFSSDLQDALAPSVGNVRIHTGNTVTEDTSTSHKSGLEVIEGNRANEWSALAAVAGLDPDNQVHKSLREKIYSDHSNDGQINDIESMPILDSLNRSVASFGSVQLTDYDSSRGSAHIGFDAEGRISFGFDSKNHILGKAQSLVTGSEVEAKVSGAIKAGAQLSGETGSSENYAVSGFIPMVTEKMNNTLDQINKELDAEGWQLNSEDPIIRGIAEAHRDERFVEEMNPFIASYIAEMQEKGHHNMKDSDESSLLKSDFGKKMMGKAQEATESDQLNKASELGGE